MSDSLLKFPAVLLSNRSVYFFPTLLCKKTFQWKSSSTDMSLQKSYNTCSRLYIKSSRPTSDQIGKGKVGMFLWRSNCICELPTNKICSYINGIFSSISRTSHISYQGNASIIQDWFIPLWHATSSAQGSIHSTCFQMWHQGIFTLSYNMLQTSTSIDNIVNNVETLIYTSV